MVLSYARTFGSNVTISRSSNNYGPYQHPEILIPLTIINLLRNQKVPIYGTGINIRDWIHVYDHCRAIFKILTDGKNGETYNIAGNNEIDN